MAETTQDADFLFPLQHPPGVLPPCVETQPGAAAEAYPAGGRSPRHSTTGQTTGPGCHLW
jgi:hypothetical protein